MPRAEGHIRHGSFPLVEGENTAVENGRWVIAAEGLGAG